MPFKSKKQWKYFFSNPNISKETAENWAKHTKKKYKDLPEKKESNLSYDLEKLAECFQCECSVSPVFKYHLDNGITIDKNIFRPGSKSFLNIFNELRDLVKENLYEPNENELFYIDSDLGCEGEFEGQIVPLDLPMCEEEELDINDEIEEEDKNDAKFKGKDVELNKPKRGGSKKFYVYVKDGDKVKKVSFGDPGMSMRISDPEARSSFKARHDCENKNDKTTAGYWSCRIGRYPNLTGAKQKYTWW